MLHLATTRSTNHSVIERFVCYQSDGHLIAYQELSPKRDKVFTQKNACCELLHRTFHNCRISSTFSLEGPETAFVALCYTRGSHDEQESIYVNGSAIKVRRNLKEALEALCETDVVKRGYMVWADAMCINQGDLKEKSKLVPKMGKIYRKSWCVIDWLGAATAGSDEAFNFINGVCEARERSLEATIGFLVYMSTCKRLCIVWENLQDVVYQPYFSRLWIMQELTMSCGRSLFLCGRRIITWERMRKVYQCLIILERDLEDEKFKDILRDVVLGHDDVKSAYERVPNYHWEALDDCYGVGARRVARAAARSIRQEVKAREAADRASGQAARGTQQRLQQAGKNYPKRQEQKS